MREPSIEVAGWAVLADAHGMRLVSPTGVERDFIRGDANQDGRVDIADGSRDHAGTPCRQSIALGSLQWPPPKHRQDVALRRPRGRRSNATGDSAPHVSPILTLLNHTRFPRQPKAPNPT